MIEDDEGQMKEELKEAFRIYDRDGQGFITTEVLKVGPEKHPEITKATSHFTSSYFRTPIEIS